MRGFIAFALAVSVGTACSSQRTTELVVSAAASLSDVFEALAAEFEETHPDIDVVLNFGGSSALREQLVAGAPVDVFASANEDIARELAASGLLAATRPLATNTLVIGVPAGNPAGVQTLSDLGDPGLLVGVCAAPVPCGELARRVLDTASVTIEPDTEEPDVRALTTKVAVGELDAGLIYVTDATASSEIEAITIDSPVTTYVIGVTTDGERQAQAMSFVEFVLSPRGRAVLAGAGFGLP